MPASDIANLDSNEPGFIDAMIAVRTSEIHSRVGKRYVRPFADPIPTVVLGWLGALVTVDMYLKRGTNPQDETLALIKELKDLATSQMKEAADAVEGLFDLPLNDDADPTAITKGEPLSSGDPSPYSWMDRQAAARDGFGTRGFE